MVLQFSISATYLVPESQIASAVYFYFEALSCGMWTVNDTGLWNLPDKQDQVRGGSWVVVPC